MILIFNNIIFKDKTRGLLFKLMQPCETTGCRYGEYGSEGDDVDDSESFGCGSHLGAPAFPGGEVRGLDAVLVVWAAYIDLVSLPPCAPAFPGGEVRATHGVLACALALVWPGLSSPHSCIRVQICVLLCYLIPLVLVAPSTQYNHSCLSSLRRTPLNYTHTPRARALLSNLRPLRHR